VRPDDDALIRVVTIDRLDRGVEIFDRFGPPFRNRIRVVAEIDIPVEAAGLGLGPFIAPEGYKISILVFVSLLNCF
jgi:hypothetical protein